MTSGGSSDSLDDSGDGTSGGPRCGNGVLDPGEQCDDDNTVDDADCSADCRIPGEPQWSVEFAIFEGTENRFSAVEAFQGALFATGRGTISVPGPTELIVVRIDPVDGEMTTPLSLGDNWSTGEGLAIDTTDDTLYVSGEANSDGNDTGLVVRFDAQGPGQPLVRNWVRSVQGATSPGLLVSNAGILVALGQLNGGGFGFELLSEAGESHWEWLEDSPPGQSRFSDIMPASDTRTIVSGTLAGDAILADVEGEANTTEPFLSVSGDGLGQARFTSMAGTPEALLVGGWVSNAATGSDAWLGRCSVNGDCGWERLLGSDLNEVEEIHQVALDGVGNVVAVGLSGPTATPTVWKLSVETGDEIWTRQYPEHGPGVASFRGVVVDEDIFVVGESRDDQGAGTSVGIAMRLNP